MFDPIVAHTPSKVFFLTRSWLTLPYFDNSIIKLLAWYEHIVVCFKLIFLSKTVGHYIDVTYITVTNLRQTCSCWYVLLEMGFSSHLTFQAMRDWSEKYILTKKSTFAYNLLRVCRTHSQVQRYISNLVYIILLFFRQINLPVKQYK